MLIGSEDWIRKHLRFLRNGNRQFLALLKLGSCALVWKHFYNYTQIHRYKYLHPIVVLCTPYTYKLNIFPHIVQQCYTINPNWCYGIVPLSYYSVLFIPQVSCSSCHKKLAWYSIIIPTFCNSNASDLLCSGVANIIILTS